ncbi:MAG: UDP-N-acetylmuramoyl-L-alanyl-D-glutamate--2,6-diaminopimelate ligase [Desulfatiglandaceae bacterium]
MLLSELLTSLDILDFEGDDRIEIRGIAFDSRKVEPGWLFVALKGTNADGHDFISGAVERGAAAVVVQCKDFLNGFDSVPAMVRVSDSRCALAEMAACWYGRPSERMNIWAITGTNGKTTTSYLLEAVLAAAGRTTGVIGTINWRIGDEIHNCSATTPEPLELMSIMRTMAGKGVSDVVMEVSSHALVQQRVRACRFSGAVFTNLSRDHLDYHRTMDDYFDAKAILFENLGQDAVAVINGDDPVGKKLAGRTGARVVTYGFEEKCDVRAVETRLTEKGLSTRLLTRAGEIEVASGLVGTFNVYNVMAAAAAGISFGFDPARVLAGIYSVKGVPGRLERIPNRKSITILVDYAHSPDALLKAIEAVKDLVSGRLITVFGCGGDRDPGKRAEMGRIAAEMSDVVFITSDNPRTEDPAAIAAQIETGVTAEGMQRLSDPLSERGRGYTIELDRGAAIAASIRAAHAGDLVLIAGKGHEGYQERDGVRRPFDDRLVAAQAAGGLAR